MSQNLINSPADNEENTPQATHQRKKVFLKVAHWVLTVIALFAFARFVGKIPLTEALSSINLQVFVLLSLLQLLTLCACAGSLWVILIKFGSQIRFSKLLVIYFASNFVENITPSLKFGGEAVKIFWLRKETGSKYQTLTGALLAYKFLSMSSFIMLFTLSILFFQHDFRAVLLPYTLGIGVILVLVILFFKYFLTKRKSKQEARFLGINELPFASKGMAFFSEALRTIEQNLSRKQFVSLLLVWLLIWLIYPLKLLIISQTLGVTLSFFSITGALFSSYLVSMLPITPGGLGTFESSLILLLSSLSITTQQATGVVFSLRLFTYWLPLLLTGLCALFLFISSSKDIQSAPCTAGINQQKARSG